MSTRTLWALAGVLLAVGVLLLVLASCGGRTQGSARVDPVGASSAPSASASPASPSHTSTVSGSTSTTTATPKPTRAAQSAVAVGEQDVPAWSTPKPDQRRQEKRAVQVAIGAAQAFAHPNSQVSDQAWKRRVRAAVSEQAWAQLASVDPQRVAYTKIIGPARILAQDQDPSEAEGEHHAVIVVIPTDAGWWQALVAQEAVTSWAPMPGMGQ